MEPHAAIGNVHDDTLARQRAVAELNPRHTVEGPARLPAPLVRRQRKHDPAPCCGPLPAIGDSARSSNVCPITIARSLTRARGFSSYLPEFSAAVRAPRAARLS